MHERDKEKLRIGHVTRAFLKKAYHLAQGDPELAEAVSEVVAKQHAKDTRRTDRLVRNDLINTAVAELRPLVERALKLRRAKKPPPLDALLVRAHINGWFERRKPRMRRDELLKELRRPRAGAATITYKVVATLPDVTIQPSQVKRIHEAWVRSRRT